MKNVIFACVVSTLSFSTAAQLTNDTVEEKYVVTEECHYVNPDYCGNNSLTNGLDSNQTTLFYMYSNNDGHYFLDPLAGQENVIFVGKDDYLINSDLTLDVAALHHGQRYIGTFEDNSLWELVGLTEVKYE